MIIYKATNTINKMCYIGQTIKTITTRKSGHKNCVNNRNINTYFHISIRKYGWDNFTWEVLCECDTKEELNEMEFHYIKQYHSYIKDYGYNMTYGGDNTLKTIYNHKLIGDLNPSKRPEVRKKISESKKGCKRPDLSKRNKLSTGKSYEEIYGKDKALEIKKKMSGKRKPRKPHSNDTRTKMSIRSSIHQYEFISPDGVVYTTHSIRAFSKEHNLNRCSLGNLVKGVTKSGLHKGWKGRIL